MNNSGKGTGITFLGLLGICFIVLKLLGIIHWSWLWVLAPIWLPFVVLILVTIIIFR